MGTCTTQLTLSMQRHYSPLLEYYEWRPERLSPSLTVPPLPSPPLSRMSRAPSGESHETAWVDGCESKSGVERGEPCFRAGLALPVAGANSLLLVRLLAEGIVRVLCLVPSIQ